jgi:hypothetical protein
MAHAGASKANSAAKKAARANAALIRMETAETVRRMERSNTRLGKQAEAASFGSNVLMTGSNQRYIQDMQSEMARELRWTKEAGERAAKAAKKGANVQFKAAQWANTANTLGQVAGAVGTWYGMTK